MNPPADGAPPRIGLLTGWLSRNNGGVFEAVTEQAALIAALGYRPVVIGLADDRSEEDRPRLGEAEVFAARTHGPKVFGYAPGLAARLKEARVDLLHLHGIWMYPSRVGGAWAAGGKPYLISPHGMLDPWILGRGKLKKSIGRIGYENRNWRRATCFHALTEDEAADIARATGRTAVEIVPNAVRPNTAVRQAGDPTFVYLGRIHPKKNVEALVDAWVIAGEAVRGAKASLVIAGWGDQADVASLEAKIAQTGDPSLGFAGPVFGEAKAQLLANAHFLCLPSHSEGLPMAILEAWAAATPTVMTKHCHLDVGFARGAAIETGTDPTAIAASLSRALAAPPEEWRAMSKSAAALADERFSHAAIEARWRAIYGGLLAGSREGARA